MRKLIEEQIEMEKCKLVREMVSGESYEYYPLGKYIVSSSEVCRGRPTFKYTRIEVEGILDCLAAGQSVNQIAKGYHGRVPQSTTEEVLKLAGKALRDQTEPLRPEL